MIETLIDQLESVVGADGITTDPMKLEAHVTEWRDAVRGRTRVMVSPESTEAVAEVVKVCRAHHVAIVPQGGSTGLCAGAIPDESGEQALLSLSRMDRIRELDADDFSLVAEAGCVLANVQQAAHEAGRLFPLSLSAEGSCQIGGALSTDAGGINVIRYGTARAQVLGLEVVLPDGRIWNGLRTLRKDTAGYDLKQLFIGAEGTLGIITAASLKLYPQPGGTDVAFVAMETASQATGLLARLRDSIGDRIQAFELIAARPLRWVLRHIPGSQNPFEADHAWYALIEVESSGHGSPFEQELVRAMEAGVLADAVIAKNASEAESLWRLRHSMSEAQKPEGACFKHDISVPIARLDEFLRRGAARLARDWPDARLVVFGHVGDGNLHYNVAQPAGADGDAFRALENTISQAIYDIVRELGGSISAEHGIGTLKRAWLQAYCDPVELDLMRTLKSALDPADLLNPGKVI